MTEPGQNRSLRRAGVALLVLILLGVLVLATCRKRAPATREDVATVSSTSSASTTRLPELRSGLEIVSPNITGSLITVRDRVTGQAIQIPRADFSPQAVDRAFAQLISHQEKPAADSSSSSIPPAVVVAPAQPVTPPPSVGANSGAGSPAAPKPAAVVARSVVDENLPDFVPLYPGATTIKIASSRDHDRFHGDYEFSTSDSPNSIGKFYAQSAGDRGLMIIVNVAGNNSNGSTFTLIAEDAAGNKSLSLTASTDAGKSHGSIEFVSK